MSITTEITRLQGAKNTLKTKLNAKNDAQHQITTETIDEYGDFVDSIPTGVTPTGTIDITENGTVDVTNYASANVHVSGGGAVVSKGIDFIDYDGTLLYSYTPTEAQALTALPAGPTHEGLIFDGWNWSLAEIKSRPLNAIIGALYHTSSNLTEIDVSITKATGKNITVNMEGNKNWGDGTTDDLTTHTYEDYGDYTITCDGTSIPSGNISMGGMFGTKSSNVNKYWCKSIRLSRNVTSIGVYAFYYCYSLKNIVIPNSVTNIYAYAFSNCSIPSIILSGNVNIIRNNLFDYCYSLKNISISNNVNTIDSYAFHACYSLNKICIPANLTSIGAYAFDLCFSNLLYDFTVSIAIPTLNNINAFTSINYICKIIVPNSLYDNWITAPNWKSWASIIYNVNEIA